MSSAKETLESHNNPITWGVAIAVAFIVAWPWIWNSFSDSLIHSTGSVVGPVRAGESAVVVWHVDKATNCPGESSRVWSGADNYSFTEPTRPTNLPRTVGIETFRIQTLVPKQAPVGTLRMSVVGWYQCPGRPRNYFTLGPVMMEVIE